MRRSTKYSKYQAKLGHAKPFPIELYMTKKENSQLIYDDHTQHTCITVVRLLLPFDQNTHSNVRIFRFYHFIETNR